MFEITLAKLNALKRSGGVGYTESWLVEVVNTHLTYTRLNVMGFIQVWELVPIEGKRYYVHWNSKEYAVDYTDGCSAYDENGNMVFSMREIDGVAAFISHIDYEVDLRITEVVETIHPIDPKFLPEGIGGGGLPVVEFEAVFNLDEEEMGQMGENDLLKLQQVFDSPAFIGVINCNNGATHRVLLTRVTGGDVISRFGGTIADLTHDPRIVGVMILDSGAYSTLTI